MRRSVGRQGLRVADEAEQAVAQLAALQLLPAALARAADGADLEPGRAAERTARIQGRLESVRHAASVLPPAPRRPDERLVSRRGRRGGVRGALLVSRRR